MKYNFDEIIDRSNTNALNTDGWRSYIFGADKDRKFPYEDDEFVRMWVADMEFATAPPILDAIRNRLDRRILGYTGLTTDDYSDALSAWCRDRYGWDFPREQLVITGGVIPALYQAIEDLTEPGDKVLTLTPSYGFFAHAADYNQTELVVSALHNEDGYYSIDYRDLARKAADPAVKVLIFCNPHNPTGRVWNEDELRRLADIIVSNDLWVISDEIHCDLVRTGITHIPLGKIMPDYPRLITCMSASKTFNMAGMLFANAIIRDDRERRKFRSRNKLAGNLNPLSLAAHKAAYEEGGEWLRQLKEYLDENFRFVKEYFNSELPEAVCGIPESTYLDWVDLRPCFRNVQGGFDGTNLPLFFAENAGILLEGGDRLFVGSAEGFVRLNLAMPRSIVAAGVQRMVGAIKRR
ncbi:aminotransferase [Hornefia porci]|uniref:cysteine-S-conjugate beta-lyase n=1 Tax=Hornefia porci TaxID=2652292 RepID=A0A1Q9JJ90_9FIRM|nr:aminotransferase class I/II-fold pyridoxal phosphate-dependent enzyme [Hornefia porci]OLR56279.1 aminotransferase [Hornefia porci]